jgi:hypothetical protein
MTTVEELAKQYSVSVDEAQTKFNEYLETELGKGFEKPTAEKRAMRLLQLGFKKQSIGAPTENLDMLVFGQKDAFDSSANAREDAIKLFQSNPQKAIAEGYTDESGTPLDRDKFLDYDKTMENRNFGKPMKPNWMRVLWGVDLQEKKPTTFILKGDQAKNMEIPMFTQIRLNGKLGKNGVWNGTKSTKMQILDGDEIRVDEYVDKNLKDLKIEIEKLPEWVETHGKKDVLITEADVISVDMELNAGGSRTIKLDNETEYGQNVFVPESTPIDFGEMSRIIVFASAKKGKGDYGPTMTAMGIWAIPEFKYNPEDVEDFDQAIDYNQPDDEEIASNDKEEVADIGDDQETKTATPSLMVKVVMYAGEDGISSEEAVKQAVSNGYDTESVKNALNELVMNGEIELNDNAKYVAVM